MEEQFIIILSSPTCPPCKTLKAFLSSNGVKFKDVDVRNPEQKEEVEQLKAISKSRMVPQVFKKEGANIEYLFSGFNPEKAKTLL